MTGAAVDLPPFVDLDWVVAHPGVVLADVRSADAYAAGHLPGAIRVDLDTDLAAPPSELGRHPLPDPQEFADALGALGIGDDSVVVAYDGDAGVLAARLVWMLRSTGHDAALLDGAPVGQDTTPVTLPPSVFTARPWQQVVDIDDLDGRVVVDARPSDRFHGQNETLDPRAGHLPGAVNVPCRENLDGAGRLLPAEQLAERLSVVEEGWASSCGSGVTACHNLLVAEHLGLPPGLLFPGSWSQWAATDRPLET